MIKGQLVVAALLLLFSSILVGAFVYCVFGNENPVDTIENSYLKTQPSKNSNSVNLECKKKLSIIEILPKGFNQHKCSVGETLIVDDTALFIAVKVPQGRLILNLGKEQ